MNERIQICYKWMAWGVFCSVIHLKVGDMKFLPPFVGFSMVAYGLFRLAKEGEQRMNPVTFAALALLIGVSFADTAVSWFGTSWILRNVFFAMLIPPALEFLAFYGGMNLMAKTGSRVRGWQAGYLIAGTVGLLSGIFGILLFSTTLLTLMGFALLAGKMLFFCCTWGESRRAAREG